MSLAHAYLSLTDDGAAPAARSPRLAAAAVLAALTLAFGIPLGSLVGPPVRAMGAKGALLDDEAPCPIPPPPSSRPGPRASAPPGDSGKATRSRRAGPSCAA